MSDRIAKTPDAKKRKPGDMNNGAHIGNAAGSPAAGRVLIDVNSLQSQWAPAREQRVRNGEKKVRSVADGPLRGGDWVLNADGQAATLSFIFEHEEEIFGLTVGHLAKGVGDSIFVFAESDMLPNPDGTGKSYFQFEIGVVVSKSQDTDSLIFKINTQLNLVVTELMKLSPESGLITPLELPDVTPQPPPTTGTVVVGFGAQRRGGHGTVHTSSKSTNGRHSRIGNIGIISSDGEGEKLTDPGDCGTLFLGVDGTPLYFHHCATQSTPMISWGFPFADVVAAHTQLGGHSEQHEDQERVPLTLTTGTDEYAGLKQFKTTIVNKEFMEAEENDLAQFSNVITITTKKCAKKQKT